MKGWMDGWGGACRRNGEEGRCGRELYTTNKEKERGAPKAKEDSIKN